MPNFRESNSNMRACLYGRKIATQIIAGRNKANIREEIIRLHTEKQRTASQIAEIMENRIPVSSGVSKNTIECIIRRVLNELVDKDTRRNVASKRHREVIVENSESVRTKREKWMREQGMFVWTDEEADFFKELLLDESNIKPVSRQHVAKARKDGNGKPRKRKRCRPYNHDMLAEKLNNRFETDKFTDEITRRKLERIRAEEKKKKKATAASPSS